MLITLISFLLFEAKLSLANGLTISVIPRLSQQEIVQEWSPLFKYIEKTVGKKIKYKHFNRFEDFENAVSKGEIDIAYVNPYMAVTIAEKHYSPIVRSSNNLVGILLVPVSSSIKSVKELNGKTISFPPQSAFAASIVMNSELRRKEHIVYKEIYAKNHSNSYRNCLLKITDACAGVQTTLDLESEELRSNLRVLYKTRSFPAHPLVVNKVLSSELVERIKNAVLRFAQLNYDSPIINPVEVKDFSDYQQLRNLHE